MKTRIYPLIKIGSIGIWSCLILVLLATTGMMNGCTSSTTFHQNSQITPNKIEELVLTLSDLPEGSWRLSQGKSFDNRMAAREMTIGRPDEWLRRFESWGRIDGYRVEFRMEQPGMISGSTAEDTVYSEVEIFGSADGAREAFRKIGEINQSTEYLKEIFEKQGMEINLHRFDVRKDLDIGHECYMVHLRLSTKLPPLPSTEAISVVWRRDQIVSMIIWTTDNLAILESDVVNLAKAQDYRIEQKQSK